MCFDVCSIAALWQLWVPRVSGSIALRAIATGSTSFNRLAIYWLARHPSCTMLSRTPSNPNSDTVTERQVAAEWARLVLDAMALDESDSACTSDTTVAGAVLDAWACKVSPRQRAVCAATVVETIWSAQHAYVFSARQPPCCILAAF